MILFDYEKLGGSYHYLLRRVIKDGEVSAPRGLKIKELRPLVLRIGSPEHCIVKRPGFSHAFMYMEIAQLLAGVFDKRLLEVCSKNAASMLDAYGAYGPRTREQLEHVVIELEHDPDSRRAMVYVGRPDDLRLANDYGMTCSQTWQFFARNGTLEMHVSMRSWDLVWGLSYDVPCFVAVQQMMAAALNLPLGSYTHVAGSGHVYERHWDLEAKPTDEELPDVSCDDLYETRNAASHALFMFKRTLEFGGCLVLPLSWRPAEPYWQKAIDKARATR